VSAVRLLGAFLLMLVPATFDVANLAALVVAAGTATAGGVAWLRLRQDRPKVVEEVAGLAERRLREELRTAWDAVDRLREHEAVLMEEQETCRRRMVSLERERDAAVRERELMARRLTTLEQRVAELLSARRRGSGS
jgi:chromosome segregation ATPase